MRKKNGQVGPTITWIPAFTIIVFLMILFIAFTLVLASHKVVPDLAMNKILSSDSIEKTVGMGDLESGQKFLYLLNYPVDKGDFRDLVIRYNKDSGLKENVNGNVSLILEDSVLPGRCFIFNLDNNYLRNKNFEVESRIYPELFVRVPENKNGNMLGLYFGKC